jgi:hypothetical protein
MNNPHDEIKYMLENHLESLMAIVLDLMENELVPEEVPCKVLRLRLLELSEYKEKFMCSTLFALDRVYDGVKEVLDKVEGGTVIIDITDIVTDKGTVH